MSGSFLPAADTPAVWAVTYDGATNGSKLYINNTTVRAT